MEFTFGLGWLALIGLVFFIALYFVIKWGVAAGILHAEELRKNKENEIITEDSQEENPPT